MVQLVVGVVIGVIGSLVAWWIVARAVRPTILISPAISRLPESRRNAPWRYRIKVVNGSRRWPLPRSPLVDVRIVVTLRIRGLDPKLPRNTNNYTLPLPHDGRVPLISKNTLVRIRPDELVLAERPLLASAVARDPTILLDLGRLLRLGTESKLRIMVTASDAYTHATTTAIAYYTEADIRDGKFRLAVGKASLDIVPASPDDIDEETTDA